MFNNANMDDAFIDELLADCPTGDDSSATPGQPTNRSENETKRARLAAIAAGGCSKQYLGKTLGLSEVDQLSDQEVTKLYDRYEARLGSMMAKSLGGTLVKTYAAVASTFLPIPRKDDLASDLETDPFVSHAISTAACELYHRFGNLLAPLAAGMITAKHVQFEEMPRQVITSESRELLEDGTSDRGDTGASC